MKLFLAAFDFPRAGFDGGGPRLGEVVDGQPERVFEEAFDLALVEHAQRKLRRARRRNARQRPQRFDAHARMIVLNTLHEKIGRAHV